jgi:hypothetical protein
MKSVEILLLPHEAIRHGDYGLIHDLIRQLPILFWGVESKNYGPEMLYFVWLLSPEVCLNQSMRGASKADLCGALPVGAGTNPSTSL